MSFLLFLIVDLKIVQNFSFLNSLTAAYTENRTEITSFFSFSYNMSLIDVIIIIICLT